MSLTTLLEDHSIVRDGLRYLLEQEGHQIEAEFGDPKQGYQWSTLFLPNGTHICMEYRREKHYAAVKHGSIVYEDDEYSPSELARVIANNTSRNAWRDLMIKRPQDTSWTLADVLRNQKRP